MVFLSSDQPSELTVLPSLQQLLDSGVQAARLAVAAITLVQKERYEGRLSSEEFFGSPQSYQDEDDHHDGE